MASSLLSHLSKQELLVIELQRLLVSVPALGPENGGEGEKAKADALTAWAKDAGLPDIEAIKAPDERTTCGYRPNLVLRIPGQDTSRTLWIISHLDIVPPGDLSLWDGDPYVLRVENDAVIGRGVEDNHQGIVASLLVAKGLKDLSLTPPINLGILLVADEETGSAFGLDYVLKHHGDMFRPEDLILVPDFGENDGSMVEVAEKSLLWIKFEVKGKQCHASTPHLGVNTLTAAAALILKLRGLYDVYDRRDEIFDVPHSTFEATRKDANVPNVNTIPGNDVFYLDCRILAEYSVEDVMENIGRMAREIEAKYGVGIEFTPVHREDAAPATDKNSPIVTRLIAGIKEVYGVNAFASGIGGGTVAAYLRRKGLPAAVWGTWVPNAHQPNEQSRIATNIGDAQVIAHVLFNGNA